MLHDILTNILYTYIDSSLVAAAWKYSEASLQVGGGFRFHPLKSVQLDLRSASFPLE